MHYYWNTEFARRAERRLVDDLAGPLRRCPVPDGDFGVLHLAGALNERDGDDGAVGNRDARFVIGLKGMWGPDEPDEDTYRQWIRDSWKRVHPSPPVATTSTSRPATRAPTVSGHLRRVTTTGSSRSRGATIRITYSG